MYTVLYIFLSFLVTGVFVHPPEQYLYLVNLAAMLWLISRLSVTFEPRASHHYSRVWFVAFIMVAVIAFLAVIAINSHDEVPNSQKRFEIGN